MPSQFHTETQLEGDCMIRFVQGPVELALKRQGKKNPFSISSNGVMFAVAYVCVCFFGTLIVFTGRLDP